MLKNSEEYKGTSNIKALNIKQNFSALKQEISSNFGTIQSLHLSDEVLSVLKSQLEDISRNAIHTRVSLQKMSDMLDDNIDDEKRLEFEEAFGTLGCFLQNPPTEMLEQSLCSNLKFKTEAASLIGQLWEQENLNGY